MQPSAHSTPVSWDNYAALQAIAEQRRRVDHKSWAIDEQLDSLLDSFGDSNSLNSSGHSVRRLNNLVTNRAKKHRNRNRLVREEYALICPLYHECKKLDCLCNQETIIQVRGQVTAMEWATFEMIADGDDYVTIATRREVTVPALKSRIYRCRERLRAIA